MVEVLGVLFGFGVFLNNPTREVFGIKFNSYLKVIVVIEGTMKIMVLIAN